jgi:hypothetical protein
MAPKTPKPPDKSKTVAHAKTPTSGLDRRNSWRLSTRPDRGGDRPPQPGRGLHNAPNADADPAASRVRLASLASEWTLDLRVLGRSPRTIGWYEHKVEAFITASGAETLEDLTAFELEPGRPQSQRPGSPGERLHRPYERAWDRHLRLRHAAPAS